MMDALTAGYNLVAWATSVQAESLFQGMADGARTTQIFSSMEIESKFK